MSCPRDYATISFLISLCHAVRNACDLQAAQDPTHYTADHDTVSLTLGRWQISVNPNSGRALENTTDHGPDDPRSRYQAQG